MEYKKGCTITNPVLRNPFYSISYFSSYWKVGILNLYNNPPTMEATRSGLPCSEPSYVLLPLCPSFGRQRADGSVREYAYNQEQLEKIDILKIFLEKYNDGRKKSFYCLAVNLLELEELKSLIKQIETNSKLSALTKKEQAKYVFDLFQDLAKQHSLILKLNKKSKK